MNIKVFSLQGQQVKEINVKPEIFNIELNKESVFTSVIAENASTRQGTHSTKTKSEVSGGGKKPWAQKGTGNARQGSTRNPQWRHGGVAFGPKPNKNYEIEINKKSHKLALSSVLSDKFLTQKALVVNEIKFDEFSTKKAIEIIKNLNITDKKVLIITNEFNAKLAKSLLNVPNYVYETSTKASPKTIIHADFLVIDEASVNKYNKELF